MEVWDRLRKLFEIDDGGLYDVRLLDLSEVGVVAACGYIRSRAIVSPPDARFWHNELERDELVADYPNAAQLVVLRVAQPFHILVTGLIFNDIVLPDLGVFVWPDEITLDYRMGPDWGPFQLLALFELLRQLVAVAGGRVSLDRNVQPEVNVQFVSEWQAYCARCEARCKPAH